MLRFSYIAISSSGQRTTGTMKCNDRSEGLKRLLARGYHPLEMLPVKEHTSGLGELRRRLTERVSVSNLAMFTRQLAALLKAGLPMVHALATLRKQMENKKLLRIIEDVEECMSREGVTLAEALEEHPRVFDAVYRGLVKAGEEGGKLIEVLGNLSVHLSRSARLRGQILGAFIYPIFISVLGFAAVFVLMTFVIPQFKELFDAVGDEMPLPTKMLITTSEFMSEWWWVILAAMGSAIGVTFFLIGKPGVRKKLDKKMLKIPLLGQMFMKLEVSRISRTLGALLNSGVGILIALRVTGDTARNLAIKNTFPQMIRGISSGETVAAALESAEVFPSLMVNLVRTGEDTGDLPNMLMELSSLYEDEAERAVSGAVKLIEPLLIVIVGGVVAGIVAAVMLPIFEANTMVG